MLKAVIFDMDGVIIDSEPLHAQAIILALQQYNINVDSKYISQFVGSTAYYMCQRMVQDFQLPITPEQLLEDNNAYKKSLVETSGYPPIPYVIDLIRDLHEHEVKLIIASSSPSSSIEYVMDSLNIRNYFCGYISGLDLPFPKPAPDIFLAASDKLGISPEKCLVIEDSCNGVKAAYAAGMTSIGFVNPNSGNQDLRLASMLVEGFEEVNYEFIHSVYCRNHYESNFIITTDRLILQEMPLQDVPLWCDICNHPDISSSLTDYSGELDEEIDKHRAYIESVYRYYRFGLWGIYRKKDLKLIGRCGVEYKSICGKAEYELSYILAPDEQGKGYGIEAAAAVLNYIFRHHEAERIIAVIDPANRKSCLLADKLGMTQHKECIIRNHKEYVLYSICRTTYYNSEVEII